MAGRLPRAKRLAAGGVSRRCLGATPSCLPCTAWPRAPVCCCSYTRRVKRSGIITYFVPAYRKVVNIVCLDSEHGPEVVHQAVEARTSQVIVVGGPGVVIHFPPGIQRVLSITQHVMAIASREARLAFVLCTR